MKRILFFLPIILTPLMIASCQKKALRSPIEQVYSQVDYIDDNSFIFSEDDTAILMEFSRITDKLKDELTTQWKNHTQPKSSCFIEIGLFETGEIRHAKATSNCDDPAAFDEMIKNFKITSLTAQEIRVLPRSISMFVHNFLPQNE